MPPVEYRPVLRDDRHASRWHERPAALLSQIARLANALVEQQPASPELLNLTLQYLSEERAEDTTPEWAADLGLVGSKAPTNRPALSKELVTSIVTGIKQELSLCRLQVSQRSKESYAKWLSDSSVGGLKPLYKCIRKYEASVERPFSTFSAASKLLLRLQQWSQLWRSSGTKPEPCFEDLKRRACEQAQALPAITGDRVEQYMRRAPLKAPGPDGWTPHLMRALTAEQCHRLASIMRQAELNGSFPEQWSVSLVILLPKNLEIERPIALMHVLLKAWMKLRWRLLEQWQESFASQGWWDSCGPGHWSAAESRTTAQLNMLEGHFSEKADPFEEFDDGEREVVTAISSKPIPLWILGTPYESAERAEQESYGRDYWKVDLEKRELVRLKANVSTVQSFTNSVTTGR